MGSLPVIPFGNDVGIAVLFGSDETGEAGRTDGITCLVGDGDCR